MARSGIGRFAGRAASRASSPPPPPPLAGGAKADAGGCRCLPQGRERVPWNPELYNAAKRIDTAPPKWPLRCSACCAECPTVRGRHPPRPGTRMQRTACSAVCRSTACRRTRTAPRGSCAARQSGTWTRACSPRAPAAWTSDRERRRSRPTHGAAAWGGRGRNLRPCRSLPVHARRAAKDAVAAAAPGRGKGRRRPAAGERGAAGTAAFLPTAGAGATG